jgi:hypothetical protein
MTDCHQGTFSQKKYALELLKKVNMQDCKPTSMPIASSLFVDNDEHGINVDVKMYQCMIGYLLHLTASRLNIMFSHVYMCAR